ncbi:probable nucleoredoxin 1 [Cucurbita pepo subsp. pepo]|uniref:probable nucleoredoxin 1 n=1 Tax=Cucurbita pepo subsp. pepo TaxID=3664 RepID=UPI000C9D31A9|nr:probable nucleoredoxin 1 [Cucurbita pepo subsp. pepo]
MASDAVHDLSSLFSSEGRDFLIRNNGDQVKISSLIGKIVGLYFSASWCPPCHRFTPIFAGVYEELASKGDFEVVFVSADSDDESFEDYFSKMPWLSIPFSDSATKERLNELFEVRGIPHLVVLDAEGKVSTDDGVRLVSEYGANAYPFTSEQIQLLKDREEEAKRNQTISSILVSNSRNYVISNNGNQIPVSELEGKVIGLYFSVYGHETCDDFTPLLVDAYKKLKEGKQNFEIVLISLDDEDDDFNEAFKTMPWLALPFKDEKCQKLIRYFELSDIPTLVIIGQDGKTLHPNAAELIEEHGTDAYPFNPEKLEKLAEIQKAKLESQTLESLLVRGENNFVIGKNGAKIPVSELVGKNILLYFSAHWCPPCRAFLPKLIEAYNEIKQKDKEFEVVFISSDSDQDSFEEFFSGMPWLALPFGDERKKFLNRRFKIEGIPALVALDRSGRTVSTDARNLISSHGADAYPFTKERLEELEKQLEEEAKGWPEKLKHELHEEHELVRTHRAAYNCDACDELGYGWSFYCEECDFDMHPKCGLKKNEGAEEQKEEWICEGDVCRRA